MSESRRFLKIKFASSDKIVELEWEDEKGRGGWLKSNDPAPDPEFVTTLRAFKAPMLRLLKLNSAWGEELEVFQLNIGYPEEDARGIKITGKMKIENCNSPFLPSTPFLRESKDESKGGGMSVAMVELLDTLIRLADAHVERAPMQQVLELDAHIGNGKEDHENGVVLPKLGAKLKFAGDKRRTYRVTNVSSERVTVESGDLPAQVARVDQLRRDGDVWVTDYLYDAAAAPATEEMPV